MKTILITLVTLTSLSSFAGIEKCREAVIKAVTTKVQSETNNQNDGAIDAQLSLEYGQLSSRYFDTKLEAFNVVSSDESGGCIHTVILSRNCSISKIVELYCY